MEVFFFAAVAAFRAFVPRAAPFGRGCGSISGLRSSLKENRHCPDGNRRPLPEHPIYLTSHLVRSGLFLRRFREKSDRPQPLPHRSAAGGDGTGTAASGDALPQATRTGTATEKGTKQKTAPSPGPRGERFPAARQRADTPSEVLRSGTDTAPPFDPESPTEPHNPNFGLTARLKVRTAFGAARRQCSQGIPERPVRFPPRRPGTPPGIPSATEQPAALFPERETKPKSGCLRVDRFADKAFFTRRPGASFPVRSGHDTGHPDCTDAPGRTGRTPPERPSPLPAGRHRNPIFRCVPGHPPNKVAGGVGKSGGKPLFLTLEET